MDKVATFTTNNKRLKVGLMNFAISACLKDHFPDVRKMIIAGKGAERDVDDIMLTHYDCYLVDRMDILTRSK